VIDSALNERQVAWNLPLTELWDDRGTLTGERVRKPDEADLVALLRAGPVHFLVADPGLKLRWLSTPERFEFWKTVRPQIANPEKPINPAQFPNETAYLASEWRGRTGESLILLEKYTDKKVAKSN
jgi:hypothetical protein